MPILNTKTDVSKGFTLVELLIVLVVVGLLSGLVMLMSSGMLNKTRVNADISTVKSLNTATVIYKTIGNFYLNNDVFFGLNNDEDRIQALMVSGQISSAPVPNVRGTSFSWNIASQKWVISGDITPPGSVVVHVLTATDIEMGTGSDWNAKILAQYNVNYKDIIIPKSTDKGPVEMIGSDAFKNKGLTSVVIEEGITRIHARAFQNNNLIEIVFPTSITRIDLLSFAGNNLLTKITIGQGVVVENTAFPFHSSFVTAYGTPGAAGTYIFTGGNWVKQ